MNQIAEKINSTEVATGYPKYPEYKDSKVDWLDEIPNRWEERRLKSTAESVKGGKWGDDKKGDDNDLVCIRVADFDRTNLVVRDQDLTVRNLPPNQREGRLLKNGDLLLEKSGGGDKQPVGQVVIYDLELDEAVCSNFIAKISVKSSHHPRYLNYLHNTLYEFGINIKSIKQTTGIQNLDIDQYLNERVPLPSYDEQQAIVHFLDQETEKIDQLIEQKERLIELLEEKREALITRAVTKGFDEEINLKESRSNWMTKVPADWEELKFKYVLLLQRGHDLTESQFIEGDVPVYGSNGCIGYHNESTTKGPGVVVGRSGSVGEVNYVDRDYWAHNTCLYVKNFRKCTPKYAFYLLSALDLKYLSGGSAVGTLNRNYIHDKYIAIPEIGEQKNIVSKLESSLGDINKLKSEIEKAIDGLQEYRKSLISHAVTGKIDVREEVNVN